MIDMNELFKRSEVIWEQVKDVPYAFGVGMLMMALERKVKQEGLDIYQVADEIGGIIKTVNDQDGITTL